VSQSDEYAVTQFSPINRPKNKVSLDERGRWKAEASGSASMG
jgi:hypothetical protein